MAPKQKYILYGLLFLNLAILVLFAAYRMIGRDEGFYLNATRMVGLGKTLYIDFFYTQLMLMPTVFSSLALSGWQSFWILRGLAVAAGFLSAVLLFLIVLKASRSIRAALIALSMYTFSGLIISVHTMYEPLVFAHFLSLGTFFFWLHFRESGRLLDVVLAGLFLSALINHRAIFIILLPLYLWAIILQARDRRLRMVLSFLFALIPFAVPALVMMVRASGSFFFDTFIFQIYRETDRSLGYIISNRLTTLIRTVLDPHLLIILVLSIISLRYLIKSGKLRTRRDLFVTPQGMALMNLLLIAAVYFVPHPILRHYVEQYIAFAIILIAFNLETMLEKARALWKPLGRRLIITVLAALYLISLVPYIAINIYGIRKGDRRYLLSEVKKITEQMLELGRVSDTVLCEWAGYPFFTGQVPLPGSEIVGFHWPLPLDHAGYMKHKLADAVYLREEVVKRTPALVVTVNQPADYYAAELTAGYNKSYQSDVVSIYKRR